MTTAMSRRKLFEIGAGACVGAALLSDAADAQPPHDEASQNEAVVRRYFKAWETKDWVPFDAMLADDFTFTSPNGDDHISKSAFKTRCWDTQIDFTQKFDLELVMAKDDAVFIKYLCRTKSGKGFRNVELHRLRNGRIESIECYFGGNLTFPSAVTSQKN